MGDNPHANGGLLLRDLRMPDFREYAVDCAQPGPGPGPRHPGHGPVLERCHASSMSDTKNFRAVRPDETTSNRLDAVLEDTSRTWMAKITAGGRPSGSRRPGHGDLERAHMPGLARGVSPHRQARIVFVLRGVHPHRGLHVQSACQVAQDVEPRSRGGRPIASLNYLLTSHVWRQDHNGFSHQDPGVHRSCA